MVSSYLGVCGEATDLNRRRRCANDDARHLSSGRGLSNGGTGLTVDNSHLVNGCGLRQGGGTQLSGKHDWPLQ